jgi:DNA-binding protein H-NS
MAHPVTKMTSAQLDVLQKRIDLRREQIKLEAVAAARRKVEAWLAESDLSLQDILPGRAGHKTSRRRTSRQPAKYRNPANPAQTWSGKGRRPVWFLEAEKKGVKREAMEIRTRGGK